MVNRPFRVAFWALAVNLGLSLCLLMSDPEVVRLELRSGSTPLLSMGRRGGIPVLWVAAAPTGDEGAAIAPDVPRLRASLSAPVDGAAARVELRTERRAVSAGDELAVRFRLSDPESGAAKSGLKDVRVLTFLSPGVWQQRHWATALPDGLYEVRFQPPEAGLYFVFLEVASAGLPLQKAPFFTVTVGA